MTIIAILIAFAINHFINDLSRFRDNQWLRAFLVWCKETLGKLPGWSGVTGFLLILGIPLLGLGILHALLSMSLGIFGSLLLALAVLIYCFGPRDLDLDVAEVVDAEEGEESEKALQKLVGSELPEDIEQRRACVTESVFREALCRWFGVIFWFAVLGIYGALLYRLTKWLSDADLDDELKGLFIRLRQILDWPVAQLMTLSLAIATDFDSVFATWKQYHDEQGHGLFDDGNGFLLAAARRIVLTGHAARDGYADQLDGPNGCLQQSMDLVWRILGVWLTVLALMLLVGWIA